VVTLLQLDLTEAATGPRDHQPHWPQRFPVGRDIQAATSLPALNWPHDLFANDAIVEVFESPARPRGQPNDKSIRFRFIA